MNLLFSYFNDSDERIIGGEAEMRGFMVKCGEGPLERGLREIPVRLPMNDGAMEAVEYMWMEICSMLDWVIGLCHKTAQMHFPGMGSSTSECIK